MKELKETIKHLDSNLDAALILATIALAAFADFTAIRLVVEGLIK